MARALIFGLLAAALWGATDFMIRVASRGVGIFRAMLYAQATSVVAAALWIAMDPGIRGPLQHARASGWLSAVLAAVAGLTATVALYRALQNGRVSVVAPVAAGYGAVTSVLSWLTGERLATIALLGLGLLLAGAVLVSTSPRGHDSSEANRQSYAHTSGLGWALLSCFCYGVEFWIQGRFANPQLGPLLPVGIYYMFSTTVLAAVGALQGLSLKVSASEAILLLVIGLGALAGFVCLSVGFGTGHVAVVTAIGSVQSGITVALACVLAGDRLAIHHWFGLAAVIGGLGLIRLG